MHAVFLLHSRPPSGVSYPTERPLPNHIRRRQMASDRTWLLGLQVPKSEVVKTLYHASSPNIDIRNCDASDTPTCYLSCMLAVESPTRHAIPRAKHCQHRDVYTSRGKYGVNVALLSSASGLYFVFRPKRHLCCIASSARNVSPLLSLDQRPLSHI